jgi:hypothetical protein
VIKIKNICCIVSNEYNAYIVKKMKGMDHKFSYTQDTPKPPHTMDLVLLQIKHLNSDAERNLIYSLIILDIPIIALTTSDPTWQEARKYMQGGCSDYFPLTAEISKYKEALEMRLG